LALDTPDSEITKGYVKLASEWNVLAEEAHAELTWQSMNNAVFTPWN
jgi:hypothetical protein